MYVACVCCGSSDVRNDSIEVSSPRISKNGDVQHSSEGIENGGFDHASETSTVTQNGFYSKNLSNAMNSGDEKNMKLIPLSGVDREKAEKDEEVLNGKSKSRTSSPKTSMDEIVAVSEMSDLVKEKIEPNGKAYFVEDVNEKESDRSNEETSKAIAILDDILDDEEKTMDLAFPSMDDDSLASPVFREQSVVADIHREDEISMQVEDISMELDPEEIVAELYQAAEENLESSIRARAAFVVGQDDNVSLDSNQEDVHYNRLDSQKQKQFMTKLSTLLVNPKHLTRQKKTQGSTSDDGSTSPKLKKSSSEPNFVLLLDNTAANESETDSPPPHSPKTHVPPAPKFDKKLYHTIKAESELEKISIPVPVEDSASRSPVPKAPKFDPILYNTIGKTTRTQRPSVLSPPATTNTSGYSEVMLRKLPAQTPPAIDSKTPDAEDPDPSANPREAFKSKLEQLLQRGPAPILKQRPRTLASTSNLDRQVSFPPVSPAIAVTSPDPTNNGPTSPPETADTSPGSFRYLVRPFDTTKKKQKLLFDDVLKAINPETRPSTIRNSLEHRVSFSEFKNGLKKTVPPKQYLPQA